MAHLLGAEALHLEVPTQVVFDNVTLGVSAGDRIGVVGRNGEGKSSLIMMLAGRRQPDGGRVTVRGGVRIGVLDQNDVFQPGETVEGLVVGDMPEHEWAGNARIRDVISGLLSGIDWYAEVAGLSGGQQRRVALARVLAGDWDVLVLDEPTNHLDVEAISWLAAHLQKRWSANEGALIAVTHDRWFLDEVATLTWEVHDRTVDSFEGGYAAYILQRVERDRQAATTEQKRKQLAKKELAWLRRGAPARTAKPKFRIEAANALISDVPEIRNSTTLHTIASSRLGKEVVNLVDAGVSYGEHTVLEGVNWLLAPAERTGILGVNGAGKSTLLSLIDGSTQPTTGRVKRGKTVQVATLAQRFDELQKYEQDPVRVVISQLPTAYTTGQASGATELTPAQMLERLGFTNAQLSTQVKDLSGGQKRRLQLLLMLLRQPNVLILDEPTNDLDTDMLAAIEDMLDSWPGTLIVVSHDRYFLERVTDQQYAIVDHQLRHLPGGVDEYLAIRKRTGVAATKALPASSVASTQETSTTASTGAKISGASRRASEKELASVERRLAKLSDEITRAQNDMALLDQSDYGLLADRMQGIRALTDEINQLEERWLELSEQLSE